MVTNDATILRIKHDILREVARLAWEGTLDEKREELPFVPDERYPGFSREQVIKEVILALSI